MKKFLASALALAACASVAQATPVGEFDGTLYVTSASSACPWLLHGKMHMTYSPPGIGSNGPGTNFTLENLFGASVNINTSHYALASGSIVGTNLVSMDGTGVNQGSGWNFTSTARISSQTPATISNTTHNLTLIGDIKSVYGTSGCDVKFDATLYSYPLP